MSGTFYKRLQFLKMSLASFPKSELFLYHPMEKSYQVIARRWRPKQFDELVGQDHIVRTLRNAIDTKRIAHAYLFVGPRGTGKTSTARLFAKALNAEGGPSSTPDNNSEISKAIMGGSCMDVIEIDGASNNGVEQVRALRDDCQYAPTQCTYKIYIIDEVHMLSTGAFNALLKTLEEPPEHVKFFFATTEAHKVLPTIVSRCQRFEFRPISDQVITDKLAEISKAEEIKVEHAALTSIARLANGGMRDAQSILDQMISFCGSEIAESDVLDVYGLVSGARIAELAKAIGSLDYPAIIAAVDTYAEEGRDLYRILLDLEAYAREALLDAIKNGGSTNKLGMPLTTESIMRMLDALHRGEASVQRGLSEKVNFEVILLKAAEESRSRAIDSLIKQLVASGATVPEKKKP
jgi:DNA polymerase III subunit gamma/tau